MDLLNLPRTAVVSALGAATALRGARVFHPHGRSYVALVTERAAEALAACTGVADRHDAHLVVERWPLALADSIEVWHPIPSAFPLMQRMKRVLDPAGVFAAGRFVGGL